MERWKDELIALGALGRKSGKAVASFKEIDGSDGLFRIEGSTEMKRSVTYLLDHMAASGLELSIDRAGNIFGRFRGTDSGFPPVMCGSHLDSVANGGMFDGVAGVVCALEAMRRIRDRQIPLKRDLLLCVLMGEEGSAVDEACLGSRMMCGLRPLDEALALRSFTGPTLQDLLEVTGKIGDGRFDTSTLNCFVELHIEQGPVLDRQGLSIGIVEGIVGIRAYRIVIEGAGNHAGSTPMSGRKDALVAASDFSTGLWSWMRDHTASGSTAVCTVDTMHVEPNSPSVIPSRVCLTIDSRSIDTAEIDLIGSVVAAQADRVSIAHGVRVDTKVIMDYAPARLDAGLQGKLRAICEKAGLSHALLPSGAIHDAMSFASTGIPCAMVFVPSKNGVSHSPFEWTEWPAMEGGITVLTEFLSQLGS